jgi:hypothetical protein
MKMRIEVLLLTLTGNFEDFEAILYEEEEEEDDPRVGGLWRNAPR